jgi:hypothetical protein
MGYGQLYWLHKANQRNPLMKLISSLALIVISSSVAIEVKMASSLERLEETQSKAEIEFQQIRANW